MNTQVLVDGVSLACRIEGEGDPLVFVHGSVADLTTFDGQVDRFSGAMRAITYSRRFHPPNPPPGPLDVYDTVQQAEDMQGVLAAVGAGQAVVAGSSFGAYIALVSALRHPGSMRALVLCEPPMVPLLLHHPAGKPLHDAFVQNVMEPSRAAFREGRDEEGLAIFVDGIRGQPGNFKKMFPGIRADLMRFIPEMKTEFLSPHAQYMYDVSLSNLTSLSIPVLLVQGALSTPMFSAILDVLEGSIPATRRVVIPRAGHLSHLQNAQAFGAVLEEFLRSLGAGHRESPISSV